MTGWEVFALAGGAVWSVLGLGLVWLAWSMRFGLDESDGMGWGGVRNAVALALPGPAAMVWAVW